MTRFTFLFLLVLLADSSFSQDHSVAREWNEVLLEAIRDDNARPTVHARNLFHTSTAMYDAWAVMDEESHTYFLGNVLHGFDFEFEGFDIVGDTAASQEEAISYAAYRVMLHRFGPSVGADSSLPRMHDLMLELGYDTSFTETDYSDGNSAALGNYIAEQVIAYGLQDGSNEINNYANQYYEPVNAPIIPDKNGNDSIEDPNRWQTMQLEVFIDQSGNVIEGDTIFFLSPEWGNVLPFCLDEDDKTTYTRDGHEWNVYVDPGAPPYIDLTDTAMSELYRWGFSMVATWASHLTPVDTTMWDISPASLGNVQSFPDSFHQYDQFYDYLEGGDAGQGYEINPVTGMPYEPQMVKRGDYSRVVAEFWADGPDSETPPGHWFTLMNYVSDHPLLEKRFGNQGPILPDLEWDVKCYLALGGAMHDAAIAAWSCKGYYDYLRPISALRFMGDQGQSTEVDSPSYDFFGLPLVPGYIEVIKPGDPLQGSIGQHVGKMKVRSWRGPDFIGNPDISHAGVDWIRMERWWPYQRPTFVTPPFAGYVSGHSTYSRAAAEILTGLTGTEYFPGGLGEWYAEQDEFLVFENGPSEDVTLQWATYYDAANESALSRIWGGIHPPADDIPGRKMGMKIGKEAFDKAVSLFFVDADEDGYLSFEDCDDSNPDVNPGSAEICDSLDNDCDGLINDSISFWTYYIDTDMDGFGTEDSTIYTCENVVPMGFSSNNDDCDNSNPDINPDMPETCDSIDNNCNELIDEDLELFNYFIDQDNDGFGTIDSIVQSCDSIAPIGFVAQFGDCNDTLEMVNPDMVEICDSLDNDCNGMTDEGLEFFTYYADTDNDGFGDSLNSLMSCLDTIVGYVSNSDDCDDENEEINPSATEIPDNMIDENCDGLDFEVAVQTILPSSDVRLFPNPAKELVTIDLNYQSSGEVVILDVLGRSVVNQNVYFDGPILLDVSKLAKGTYRLEGRLDEGAVLFIKELQLID